MKVLIISGSRADYGGLSAVGKALKLQGVNVVFKVIESKPAEDTRPYVVSATMGSMLETLSFLGEAPDLVVLCGDRFEILGVATASYLLNWPIAHLSGGDITEGSQDDNMRHAITKLSHLHFATNQGSANRIIQMGEEPWRVHDVGYPGVAPNVMSIEEAKRKAGILSYPDDFLLVVHHPNTTASSDRSLTEAMELTRALDKVFKKTIIVGPNNDVGSSTIKNHLWGWAKRTHNQYWDELPRDVYLSLLAHCGCLVGNSSSGYYEAPTYGTPVVDIGTRQRGRTPHTKLINCDAHYEKIVTAIEFSLGEIRGGRCTQPYGDGKAAERIAFIISQTDPQKLLRKKWNDSPIDSCYQGIGVRVEEAGVRLV